jgi:uncharacterized membrane protein
LKQEQHNQVFTIDIAKKFVTSMGLSPQVEEALIAAATTPPHPQEWRSFLSWFLLFTGAALSVSGVIFFFAYNWANLGKFSKLGLLELSIIAAILGARKLGDCIGGQVLLIISVVLVGPLLAVYGQTYQTGADSYELFLGWLVLTLPWVVLARVPSLWMLSLTLLNTAFLLYWAQVMTGRFEFGKSVLDFLALILINATPWALWEFLRQRGVSWLSPRWPARLMAVASNTSIVVCLTVMIVGEAHDTARYGILAAFIGVGIIGGSVIYYRMIFRDLFMLALATASTMTVLTIGFGKILMLISNADIEGFTFILGLFVVAQVAGAVTWLRCEARRMSRIMQPISPDKGVVS